VPRAAVFSGMTKDEMLGVVEFWSSSGISPLPPPPRLSPSLWGSIKS